MTVRRSREALPDVLRALAMLSVLVVNGIGYTVAPWGPPLGATPDSLWTASTQALVAALLQGKGYPMLAFVFGMALWLSTRQRPRALAMRRGVVRHRRLLGLGIVHGVFVYFGDILTLYALVGRRLLGRLHQPWGLFRRHLRRALLWAVLAKLAMVAFILGYTGDPGESHGPSLAAVDGPWAFLRLNAGTYAIAQVAAILLAGPVMYLCMAAGVAAARLRLLTHRRWRTGLQRVVWRGGPAVFALSLVCGWGLAFTSLSGTAHTWFEAIGELVAPLLAVVYTAAVALWSAAGAAPWCQWFRPLGQRTLTLYVGHGVLGLLLFSGAGLALAPDATQMVLFCVGLWLLALWGAGLSGTRRWPLEAWMGRD